MNIIPPVEFIFLIIGFVFLALALREYVRAGRKMSVACKIRLRMGIIFIAVGTGLYFILYL